MRTVAVLALMMMWWSCAAVSSSCSPPTPDFSWAKDGPPAAREALQKSEADWTRAALCVDSRTNKQVRLDVKYLHELVLGADFSRSSYTLLDAVILSEDKLQQSRTLYEKAAASAHPSLGALDGFTRAYNYERSVLRLAAGLARAGISQAMASSNTSGYCIQAMEAAIDALRDAAKYADLVGGCTKWAESIRKLRSALFDAWERAQKSKDVGQIGTVDLRRAFEETLPWRSDTKRS